MFIRQIVANRGITRRRKRSSVHASRNDTCNRGGAHGRKVPSEIPKTPRKLWSRMRRVICQRTKNPSWCLLLGSPDPSAAVLFPLLLAAAWRLQHPALLSSRIQKPDRYTAVPIKSEIHPGLCASIRAMALLKTH